MKFSKLFKENGLSIVLLTIFFLCLIGHGLTGQAVYNEERAAAALNPLALWDYLKSGHFIESLFENWESEFLQMAMYVLLTVWLIQKGSAESKKPNAKEKVDEDPALHQKYSRAPWPVRTGGLVLKIYSCSLTLALLGLFVFSFVLHLAGGLSHYNEERLTEGLPLLDWQGYLVSSRFWFESFQNWQSEFLSVAAVVILSIFLRQKGSPESKPVHFPHSHTGKD